MIPAEAVEAAGEFLPPVWTSNEVYRARLIQALEAAATHMLSHEREQTRLAHLDAMVNRETKQAELADAWELGMVSMYATTGGEWPLIPEQNPYRSETMSQLIPMEAVGAAAEWLHDNDCRSAFHSGHPADIVCYDWMDEAKELVETIAPHMLRSTRIALLVSRGLPGVDAETALDAYERTPAGFPCGADAVRVASILGVVPAIPDEAVSAIAPDVFSLACGSRFAEASRSEQADAESAARRLLEAAAPHMLASTIEGLAEARNEDDTKFIFTWGQRDWLATEAKRIRSHP